MIRNAEKKADAYPSTTVRQIFRGTTTIVELVLFFFSTSWTSIDRNVVTVCRNIKSLKVLHFDHTPLEIKDLKELQTPATVMSFWRRSKGVNVIGALEKLAKLRTLEILLINNFFDRNLVLVFQEHEPAWGGVTYTLGLAERSFRLQFCSVTSVSSPYYTRPQISLPNETVPGMD